ncbi:hypothetical protein EYV94_04735 [Puteibacter caeruleilacunae]|nr:hypothetical protein EYV94_04735 [Puteibacter caeruleilacunae]
MTDLPITIVHRGEKNKSVGGCALTLLGVSSIIIVIIILLLIPSRFSLEHWGYDFIVEWKWGVLTVLFFFVFGLILKYLNRENIYGKLIFKEDEIVEMWKDKVTTIRIDHIVYLSYVFTDVPVESEGFDNEEHWITIKQKFPRRKFRLECLIDKDQIALMEVLYDYKNRGIKVEIDRIY